MVCYVPGSIANPRRQCCLPPNSYWMVDMFAWILRWISWIVLYLMTPLHFVIFMKGGLLQVSSGLEAIRAIWFQRV